MAWAMAPGNPSRSAGQGDNPSVSAGKALWAKEARPPAIFHGYFKDIVYIALAKMEAAKAAKKSRFLPELR